jgi:hypothetical protein
MGNNTWENLLDPFPETAGAAFNTFTTAKDVSPTPLPTVLGNEIKVGSKIELEAFGEFSTTGTPTLTVQFLFGVAAGAVSSGGVVLAASGAITTGSAAAAWPWHAKWVGTVTAVGTSGSVKGGGVLDLGTSLTAYAASAMPITQALRTVTIDTTVSKTFGVGAAWSASSASNQIIVDTFTAKILNQGKTS